MTQDNTILISAAQFVMNWCESQSAMWVSAGGGTANVLAGELSRFTGFTFDEAHEALNAVWGDDWYENLWWSKGIRDLDTTAYTTDARGVGKALARRFNMSTIPLPYENMDVLTPRKGMAFN